MPPTTLTTTHGDLATALITILRPDYERSSDALLRFDRWEKSNTMPRETLCAALADQLKASRALAAVDQLMTRLRPSQALAYKPGTWVLAGGVGTGKSVAAARWAFGFRAHWLHASELGLAPPFAARDEIRDLRARRSLVIDELGGPGSTGPAAVERLASLLSMRHSDGLATLVTTNLDQEAFARTYDGVDDPKRSRLLDRVRERGRWFDCDGASFRGSDVAPPTAGDPPRIQRAKRLVRIWDALSALERDAREGARVGMPLPTEIAAAIGILAERGRKSGYDVESVIAATLEQRAAMLASADALLDEWRADGVEADGEGVDAIVGGLLATKAGR